MYILIEWIACILERMTNATQDFAFGMIECILSASSTAPRSVVQHVQDTITDALQDPSDLIDNTNALG
jgi:hypothetical protein